MKLLIIEDEKELAASIASYLKNENYTCEVASNFKQALDKIETSDYECIASGWFGHATFERIEE